MISTLMIVMVAYTMRSIVPCSPGMRSVRMSRLERGPSRVSLRIVGPCPAPRLLSRAGRSQGECRTALLDGLPNRTRCFTRVTKASRYGRRGQ